MKNKGQKVSPITAAVADYKVALETLNNHQTLPALLNVIDKALHANTGFAEITSAVTTLFSEPDDKFWGAWGSKYFWTIDDNALGLSQHRPKKPTLQSGLEALWKPIVQIEPEELISFEKTLVNSSTLSTLTDLKASQSEEDLDIPKPSGDHPPFDKLKKLVYEAAVATEESSNESKRLASVSSELGIEMIPWAFAMIRAGEQKSPLIQELIGFSNYLANYYRPLEKTRYVSRISSEHSNELAKLLCATIFSRILFHAGLPIDSIDNCLNQRLTLVQDKHFSNDPTMQTQYIVSIVNASLLCSILGTDSLALGILNEEEVSQRDFDFVNAYDHDFLTLSLVPANAAEYLIPCINPWEGDRKDAIDLSSFLLTVRIGVTRYTSSEVFEAFREQVSRELDTDDTPLGQEIATYAAQNLASLSIPLRLLDCLPRITEENTWSNYKVLNSLTNRLRRIDAKGDYNNQFIPSSWLIDFIDLDLDSDSHPALFASKFSNNERFLTYTPSSWLPFVESLVAEGQFHYACVLMAFLFGTKRIFESYNSEVCGRLAPREIAKTLELLRPHQSFRLVEESLRDYMQTTSVEEPEYLGVYTAFVSRSSVIKLERVVPVSNQKLDLEKKLLELVPNLKRLDRKSWNCILNAFCQTRDIALSPYKMSGDAVSAYASGLECEIVSRIGDICEEDADELQKNDVRVRKLPHDRRVLDGLGALSHLLEVYASLSISSQDRLGLKSLAEHPRFDSFYDSFKTIPRIRNRYSHGDFDRDHAHCKRDLLAVETFLFEENGLEVLCETAPPRKLV